MCKFIRVTSDVTWTHLSLSLLVYMVEKKLSTFVVIYCCLKQGKWWVLVILIGKISDGWIRDLEFNSHLR